MRKKIVSFLLTISLLISFPVPIQTAYAASADETDALDDDIPIYETNVSTASSGCVIVGAQGEYVMDVEAALERINEIRYEACVEGVPNPSNKSAKLTLSDYKPIKWSADLEYIARIRAAEASFIIDHTRLNGKSCFSLASPNGKTSNSEVLAWNWTDGILYGINQWYDEKKDWINQTAGAVTGHYTSMINPSYTYVGLGCFLADEGIYPNCTSGEFSTATSLSETPMNNLGKCIQKIEITKTKFDSGSLNGVNTLDVDEKSKLSLMTTYTSGSSKSQFLVTSGIEWESDNPLVASVSENGVVTGLSEGVATISAESKDGFSGSITITVSHDWQETIYTWNEDKSQCDATRVCKNNDDHKETAEAVITSTGNATCDKEGLKIYTASFDVDWAESQTEEEIEEALGHDWGKASYEWDEDRTECIAKRICKTDKSHIDTAEATITSESTATCGKAGERTYTASFDVDWAKTQTVTEEEEALEHDWDKATYDWNEEKTECVATRVCKNDESHVETAEAVITCTGSATCDMDGVKTYTASFDVDWAKNQTKKETEVAFGHDWDKVIYEWDEDRTECIAKRICKTDKNHIDMAEATITSESTATCGKAGERTYTASFDVDWAKTQTAIEEEEALGHDWDKATYDWNEEKTECVATRVCKNDESHVETTEAVITTEYKAPGCDKKGEIIYKAAFEEEWATLHTYIEYEDALGHDWDVAKYEWSKDNTKCIATRVCKSDESHVEIAEATITSESTATCGIAGERTYNAGFNVGWATKQIKTVQEAALGHDWNKTTYSWNNDRSQCMATRICKNDESHIEIADAVVTTEYKASGCEEKRKIIYKATFANVWATMQTETGYENAIGHKNIVIAGKEATFTSDGLTEGKKCPVCGKVIEAQKPIYKIATIKLSQTDYIYDGKVKTPALIVKDSKGNTISSNNYTVVKDNGRINVGQYSYKVIFKGNYSGSRTLTFIINSKPTSVSKVTAVSKGLKITLKMQKTQITGYEIEVSTNSKFTKSVKKVDLKKKTTVATTIKKLKAKTKYYVRVRTYKVINGKKYYSTWTKYKKSVTTKK